MKLFLTLGSAALCFALPNVDKATLMASDNDDHTRPVSVPVSDASEARLPHLHHFCRHTTARHNVSMPTNTAPHRILCARRTAAFRPSPLRTERLTHPPDPPLF